MWTEMLLFFFAVTPEVNKPDKHKKHKQSSQNGHHHHHKSHHHHSKHSHSREKTSDKSSHSVKLLHKSSDEKNVDREKSNSENQMKGSDHVSLSTVKVIRKESKSVSVVDSKASVNKPDRDNKEVTQANEETKNKSEVKVEKVVKKDPYVDSNSSDHAKNLEEKKEEKQHSSSSKTSQHSPYKSKHHKHHHRDRSSSKSSTSEHRSHRNDQHSKTDCSHHKDGKVAEHSSQRSETKTNSEQDRRSSERKSDSSIAGKKEFKDIKELKDSKESKDSKTGSNHTSLKTDYKTHSSDSYSKSSKVDSDGSRSHHRKKRIVNCGVQVNLRRKTDTKATQVSDDAESENQDRNLGSLKISEKKLQRIAYVQQNISNSQKQTKHSKGTPKKQDVGEQSTEEVVHVLSKEFSTESQDQKFWKAEVASIQKYKYKSLMHVEQYSNGGGLVLHAYQDEVEKLSDVERIEFAREFLDFVFSEPTEGVANCVMGIVHEAIVEMPDLVEHMADTYPNLTIKAGVLGKSDIETMSMEKYREQLHKTYQAGTFRCGPLLQVSLVGTAQEEVGDYFPEVLDMFENDPFLNLVMPWGDMSSVRMASRNMSNDGPILWTRPGEQLIPTADMPKSPFKRKR